VATQFANTNKTSATNFIKEKVHKKLFSTLTSRLNSLTNNGSNIPDTLNNTSTLKTEFFRLFAAEILLLASLFNCKADTDSKDDQETVESLIFSSPGSSIPDQLIQILARTEIIDPLLLAALCKLCIAMFSMSNFEDCPENLEFLI